MGGSLALVFQYFLAAGAGVALGAAAITIPAVMLYKKIGSGDLWQKKNSRR
jgi:hypothetical protein